MGIHFHFVQNESADSPSTEPLLYCEAEPE